VASFGISGVEPLGSGSRELSSDMDLREIGCEDGRWIELAFDSVHCRALELAVLNLWVMASENWLISKLYLRDIIRENGRWMELGHDRLQWRGFVLAMLNL
jgi:hypothetical protein